jgi:hypothetical protein
MGVPLPGTVGGASEAQPTTQRDKNRSHFIGSRVIPPKAAVNEPTTQTTVASENGTPVASKKGTVPFFLDVFRFRSP